MNSVLRNTLMLREQATYYLADVALECRDIVLKRSETISDTLDVVGVVLPDCSADRYAPRRCDQQKCQF